jgi:hypothetical protein
MLHSIADSVIWMIEYLNNQIKDKIVEIIKSLWLLLLLGRTNGYTTYASGIGKD